MSTERKRRQGRPRLGYTKQKNQEERERQIAVEKMRSLAKDRRKQKNWINRNRNRKMIFFFQKKFFILS